MNSAEDPRDGREEKSKIDELKNSLYSRNAPPVTSGRKLRLRPKNFDVKKDWAHPKDPFEDGLDAGIATASEAGAAGISASAPGASAYVAAPASMVPASYDPALDLENTLKQQEDADDISDRKIRDKKRMSFFSKMLIGSFIFFLVCVGVGAYLVWRGSDIVSANNVDITLAGPVSVQGGDPVSFTVQVSNKNKVALQVVNTTIDYPSGTANPTDPASVLKETQQTLPDIAAGGVGQENIGAIFYGEVNSQKTVQVTVTYQVAGSNATFTKEKDFNILISSSPLTISATSFSQVTSGQPFDIDVTVTSNSAQTIDNLLLKASYPFGFTYASATPRPVDTAQSVWAIGDLPAGGTAVIHIKGTLAGEDQEARVFNFSVGAAQEETTTGGIGNTLAAQTIGTEYIAGSDSVIIEKPFLSLNLSLNGDSTDQQYNGAYDTPITGQITWFNNTTDTIQDGEIDLNMSGTAFDTSSVSPSQGFYNSANSQIVWNQVTTPDLKSIPAGGSGTVTFSITPRNNGTQANPITDPQISLALSAKGNRLSETNVPEAIDSSVTKNILISSNVALSGQLERSVGPFTNTGPIPPAVNQETTYTVIWTIYNTSSTLDGVQVAATLPPYVQWLGEVSPASAGVTYDKNSGQVTWNIGNVSAYTTGAAEQVAFQIGVTPDVNQVGQSPDILGNAVLNARDDFTGANLTSTVQAMTTRYSTDPSFNEGDEIVAK